MASKMFLNINFESAAGSDKVPLIYQLFPVFVPAKAISMLAYMNQQELQSSLSR